MLIEFPFIGLSKSPGHNMRELQNLIPWQIVHPGKKSIQRKYFRQGKKLAKR